MSFFDTEIFTEFPRSNFDFDFRQCCNPFFFKKTRLKFVPLRKFLPVKKFYLEKTVVLFLASHSPYNEIFESCHHFWYVTFSKLKFLSHNRFDSSIKASVETSLSCRGGIDWEIADNILCIKFFTTQIVQKVVTRNGSSELSKGCFTVATDVIFFTRVRISNSTLSKKNWSFLGHLVFCLFSL